MADADVSTARRRFDDALRFSTALNETLSAQSILDRLSCDQARLVMREDHTFMLLVMVGAFDAFTTERCQELDLCPLSPAGSPKARPISPVRALFRDKLYALRAATTPTDKWAARVEDAYELYYKARTLWIHGAGIPGAVREGPRDLSLLDRDSEGRYWVNRNLWSGCAGALKGLADDCR